MTVGMHYSRYQQGIVRGFYEYRDDAMVQRLSEIISDLAIETDKGKLAALWKNAQLTLAKTSFDSLKAARVIADRNVEALARTVTELTARAKVAKAAVDAAPVGGRVAGAAQAAAQSTPAPAVAVLTPPAPPVSGASLKSALKAFKKRLKVTRLDNDSRVSSARPLTSKQAHVIAITPPSDYPRAVWEALAKEGKLKRSGSGLYELVEG